MNKDEANAFLIEQIRIQASKNRIQFEPEEEINLFNSGLYDSLSFFGLISQVESRFNIKLNFAEFEPEEFTTLAGLKKIVDQHVSTDA